MTPVTLGVSRWHRDPPAIGQYLKSRRGRFAYLIVGVHRCRPGSKAWGRVDCLKIPAAELPADAVIRGWQWNSRG